MAVGLACAAGVVVGPIRSAAAQGTAAPATVAEARKVLDLAAFPLMDRAEDPSYRNLAGLTYAVSGAVPGAFEAQRKALTERGWTEQPNSSVSDQAASGTFRQAGYSLSLTVYPTGKPGQVMIMLLNHGNVDLGKLPVPLGAKPFYGGPVSTAYLTDAAVEPTAEACRKPLLERGWKPYGVAGDVHYFKQNAVQLAVRVAAAPAQGGKTVIDYSTLLMSVDLPAPAEADGLQYSDSTAQLTFDTKASAPELVDFYRQALAPSAWKSTTQSANKIGFKNVLIFVNPQKDLLTLEIREAGGKRRALLKHQTAAEVVALERRLDAGAARRKVEGNKPLPKLALTLPRDASEVKLSKNGLEFKVGTRKARPAVATWRAQLSKEGWTESAVTLDAMAGSISFSKGNQHLTVIYSDVGFLPAEVSIQAIGVELERTGNDKP